MSAKDNFAQAMKELLNTGAGAEAEKPEDKKPAPSSFSSFSQPPKAAEPEAPEEKPSMFGSPSMPPAYKPEEEAPEGEPVAETDTGASVFGEAPRPAAAPAPPMETAKSAIEEAPVMPDAPVSNTDMTSIGRGTTIVGDITTGGAFNCAGNVKGNVKVATLMQLDGKIIGDVEAEDAKITNSDVKGNITLKNNLEMDQATTVIGDVVARSVTINGKVKGNLTVEDRAHFEANAVLVGNLQSGTVIIDEGAMLKGDIAITSAQDDNVEVSEPDFEIEDI